MDNRYAVIDLGTNTFHLLIADRVTNGSFKELYRKRIYVKLAEDGIERIGDKPFQRGLDALTYFHGVMDEFQVKDATAFGTAALRTAENGGKFIQSVADQLGIQIQIIPGDREAELIYKGVVQAVDIGKATGIIMDIGGGSVEFILYDQKGVHWAQSFPLGVAVLFNAFHKNDPITEAEIKQIEEYLQSTLAPLFPEVERYQPSVMVGASGTFDVLQNMLCENPLSPIHGIVRVEDFNPMYERLLKSNLQDRLDDPDIPDSRAELIIVALILINFLIKHTPVETISVSAYAMKEGILSELIQEKL
jgi:exopolyphosphatase/guanosine-5'-triphosphate,3'-diphosphate pyrophosphatase